MKEIQVFRNEQNMTQAEMANKIQVSLSYLQKIENGKNPSFNFLRKIKEQFAEDVDMNRFFNKNAP